MITLSEFTDMLYGKRSVVETIDKTDDDRSICTIELDYVEESLKFVFKSDPNHTEYGARKEALQRLMVAVNGKIKDDELDEACRTFDHGSDNLRTGMQYPHSLGHMTTTHKDLLPLGDIARKVVWVNNEAYKDRMIPAIIRLVFGVDPGTGCIVGCDYVNQFYEESLRELIIKDCPKEGNYLAPFVHVDARKVTDGDVCVNQRYVVMVSIVYPQGKFPVYMQRGA